ncbi:DUF6341 family protein [Flavobacterium sp. '19STA2R22 D10 B1']|uniref:DUF6341 family protein n=1 Tax=Flavobacterium aerium TaxID=3037261 RepID=UPI00278C0D2A|nr:uracil phosphoribosyltransferase [Flavobacterium sp. '19STA2R22 D10 B1']
MKAFFEGIQYLFEKILFIPMDFLRKLELENWWVANIMSWIFAIICIASIVYWVKQLKLHKDNNEENQDTSAHSFLS